MNNLQPTDMNGTLIADLIDMVQKRMGIDLESLEANPAGNLVSGSTLQSYPPRVMPQIPAQLRTCRMRRALLPGFGRRIVA
jgi:hypothetical protein